jgi:hypothetical protein
MPVTQPYTPSVHDEALRIACFSRVAILEAEFGEELPYRGALDQGFPFHRLASGLVRSHLSVLHPER